MFTFSKNKENTLITGTIYGDVFGVKYSEVLYKSMQDLETELVAATTGQQAKEITEKFKVLTVEDPNAVTTSDVHPDIYVANTGDFYLMVSGKKSSVPMPSALVNRMRDALDKGLSIDPLIKFWIRFLRNHKLREICSSKVEQASFAERVFNYVNMDFLNEDQFEKLIDEKGYTPEIAEAMCTVKQVRITQEGLLATYKVSREITKRYKWNEEKKQREEYDINTTEVIGVDEITGLLKYAEKKELANEQRVFEPAVQGTSGDEFFCGETKGHIIRVGQVHKLESWNQIDISDYRSCVPGLHVGGLDYIKGYQNSGTETHNVLVDPAHIGAVPDDRSGAIRCVQYFVLDAFSGVNGSIYHSSTYGKLTDAQWEEEKAAIIKEFGELKAAKEDAMDELKAL